jgi:23S rRNA maturation-related 3'-5' exoribonuclease YhaM
MERLDIENKVNDVLLNIIGFNDDQMAKLRNMKYYSCPASTKYHGNFEGGLIAHSYRVYTTALKINEALKLDLPIRSIAIASLFHDINKLYAYKYDGKKYIKDEEMLGDGDLSVNMLIANFKLDLNTGEYYAIRYHNVFEEVYKTEIFSKLYKNFKKEYLLCWLIQTSDMYSATVLEI